ncbi:TPA: hypothetical protein N6788_000400 [Escherichia coli]|nr:hypothetical protein [Escherichia coli]
MAAEEQGLQMVTIILAVLAIVATIVAGIPAYLLYSPQAKEVKRLKKKRIIELLVSKNWNNVGDIRNHNENIISIKIESSDVVGNLGGTITNCSSTSLDEEKCTFTFSGKLNHKGQVTILLCIQIGWRDVPIGEALLSYNEDENTLKYKYLKNNKDNEHLANEYHLPKFEANDLIGC